MGKSLHVCEIFYATETPEEDGKYQRREVSPK